MAEMSEKNKSVFEKVSGKLRDKMDGGINRLLTTLAFVGCVNTMSAKTVTAAIMDVDGTKTYLLTDNGKMQVESASLVRAITAAHNKKGGDLIVKFNFDENTSRINNGKVYHSRVKVSSGISDAVWDIRDVKDDINEMIGNVKNLNITRILNKGVDMAVDLAPEAFKDGTVRVVAENNQGQRGWAQYHTVDKDGHLKPEYDKTATRTSQSSYSYTQTTTQPQSSYSYTQTTSQDYKSTNRSTGNVYKNSGFTTPYAPLDRGNSR